LDSVTLMDTGAIRANALMQNVLARHRVAHEHTLSFSHTHGTDQLQAGAKKHSKPKESSSIPFPDLGNRVANNVLAVDSHDNVANLRQRGQAS